MTGEEARQRLVAAGKAAVLAGPALRLDLAGVDRVTARRWRLWWEARRARSVDEALRSLSGQDQERFAEWLCEQHLPAPRASAAPVRLRPGMPLADLQGWAREAGLEWAVASPPGALPDLGYLTNLLPYHSIGELIARPEGYPNMSWARPTELAARAVTWLVGLDQLAQTRARTEESLRQGYSVAPPPPLDQVWRRFFGRYAALAERHRTTLWASPRTEVSLDPPALRLEILGVGREVPLEAEPPQLGWPQQEIAVCEAVLRFLAAATPERDRVARILGTPAWQRDLEAIGRVMEGDREPDEERPLVAWEVGEAAEGIQVYPSFCRVTKAGKLQGRKAEARELVGRKGVDGVDAQVASLLHAWRTPPREVVMEALELLAGHPRVRIKGRGAQAPIPVRAGALQLALRREEGGVAVRFLVAGRELAHAELIEAFRGEDAAGGRAAFVRDQELLVARCTVDQRRLALAWAQRAPRLPPEALPQLLNLLPQLQQRIPVVLDEELRGRPVEGDPRPVLRLRMEGTALVLEVRVRPLPDAPDHDPGEPPESLHVVRDGLPRYHLRDLRDEPARVRELLESLGVPESARQGPWLWAVDDQELALDVVRAIDPERHRVETDAALPVVVDAATRHLRLKLEGSGQDWFGVSGRLATGEGEIPLADLMSAAREGKRYVPLGKNRFVRLEAALVARARALDAGSVAGSPRVGGVHAPLLEAVEQEGGLIDGPASWRRTVSRLKEARDAEVPLPEGLQAELRPYQAEGFTWLARQAAWSPGAVLADDMGLGKTLQAIALLLRRSGEGPALVVAPTSVAFNWEAELARFAPSLRVRVYTGSGRERVREQAAAGEVLLTTWGILVRDAEALAKVRFATLVLDESQAMKNPESQRAKAARSLDAGFRLALSGTPVENHSVELWSLFSVVVPALFGNLNAFRSRFLGSEERAGRAALAQLAGPFMLRRTKRQVAPELPERQEVTQTLDLEEAHAAAYSVGVQDALARIAAADPRTRHLVTGQELMRLRQLACDPRLADPGSPHVGPKVRWLRRSIEAVRRSGEQALVFSTYVSLLELARAELQQDGVRIAWLTGSTPPPARKAEVERFQAGEADVFLLSLKAGGTGLNLTAASYVFVLDPWFNPAAEDQAADRAHRIGQDKKVTIYRGVAKGTVEEKILALQADKRELVDALLAGSGSTRLLSPAELLLLLSGAPAAAPVSGPAPSGPPPAAPKGGRTRLSLVDTQGPQAPVPPASAPAPASPPPQAAAGELERWLAEAIARLGGVGVAPSTASQYSSALQRFVEWCPGAGYRRRSELPAAVEAYLEAGRAGTVPAGRARMLSAAWSKVGAG